MFLQGAFSLAFIYFVVVVLEEKKSECELSEFLEILLHSSLENTLRNLNKGYKCGCE